MTIWQAVHALSERRRLVSSGKASHRLLSRMATLGLASQCGRLFHVTPECDRVSAALRQPVPSLQLSMFDEAAA